MAEELYTGPEKRQGGVRVDRVISLGTLVTVLLAAIGGVFAYGQLWNRVDSNERRWEAQEIKDKDMLAQQEKKDKEQDDRLAQQEAVKTQLLIAVGEVKSSLGHVAEDIRDMKDSLRESSKK